MSLWAPRSQVAAGKSRWTMPRSRSGQVAEKGFVKERFVKERVCPPSNRIMGPLTIKWRRRCLLPLSDWAAEPRWILLHISWI